MLNLSLILMGFYVANHLKQCGLNVIYSFYRTFGRAETCCKCPPPIDLNIIKKYFVPDIYWTIPACKELTWFGNNEDEAYYEAGLVCRTKDIAMTKSKMMLAVAKE